MRPGRRPVVAAAARFVVAFAVLAAPWPGLPRVFTDLVGATATAIAEPLFASSNVTLRVRSPEPGEHLPDWRGVIDVRQDFPEGPVKHAGAVDLRRAGYLQLTTFLCLVAAWPAAWRGREVLGTSVAVVVVAATVGVAVVDFLAQVGALHLWAWAATAIAIVRRALVAAPGMAYAVPGLAWLAVAQAPPRGAKGALRAS